MSKNYKILFLVLASVGFIIGGTLAAVNNADNYVTVKRCAVSSGSYVDPRTGDGFECDEYEYVREKENLTKSFLIGGFAWGFILSFVGGWIAVIIQFLFFDLREDRRLRKQIRKQ